MKKYTRPQIIGLLSVTGLMFLLPQMASAQTNFTTENFNTNAGYVRGSGIISPGPQGQPAPIRWQGNDPYNAGTGLGETDLVARATGYTPLPLANSSLLQGGLGVADSIFPGTNNVQIWKSFPSYTNYGFIAFQAEWSIIGSSAQQAPYTNQDTFSFDLRNVANTASLLKLQFTPGINIQTNSYTLQSVVNGTAGAPIIDLGYGGLFTTEVAITSATNYSISIARINPETRAVITNYADIASGTLSTGLSANDFGTIGLDWELTSTNAADPGSNYIIVNDIQVVPEPSTYALLALSGIAGVLLVLRRRRA